MSNLFLCKFKDHYKPILLVATIYYEHNKNIGKSIYLDIDNNNIVTRYFKISLKNDKRNETMIMQDAPYEYDLSETTYLPYNTKEEIFITGSIEQLIEKIKEKLTFTPNEIKKLNEYRFGTTKKR